MSLRASVRVCGGVENEVNGMGVGKLLNGVIEGLNTVLKTVEDRGGESRFRNADRIL